MRKFSLACLAMFIPQIALGADLPLVKDNGGTFPGHPKRQYDFLIVPNDPFSAHGQAPDPNTKPPKTGEKKPPTLPPHPRCCTADKAAKKTNSETK